jgi:hypothetical protein
MGLTNVRPMRAYKFVYPFDDRTMHDAAYYFDFDYRAPIDDGGYRAPLNEAVWVWQHRKDEFYATNGGERLVLVDTRPVATERQIALTGTAKAIYEHCDAIRSRAQIDQRLAERGVRAEPSQVDALLDEFVERRLMVRESNSHLSLAIMPHLPAADV